MAEASLGLTDMTRADGTPSGPVAGGQAEWYGASYWHQMSMSKRLDQVLLCVFFLRTNLGKDVDDI